MTGRVSAVAGGRSFIVVMRVDAYHQPVDRVEACGNPRIFSGGLSVIETDLSETKALLAKVVTRLEKLEKKPPARPPTTLSYWYMYSFRPNSE